MELNRRKFLTMMLGAAGAVSIGQVPVIAPEFFLGKLPNGFPGYATLEETAFWLGGFATSVGTKSPLSESYASALGAMREHVKKCRPDHVAHLLEHPEESLQWFKDVSRNEYMSAKAEKGFSEAVKLYNMTDAEFEEHCRAKTQKTKAEFEQKQPRRKPDPRAAALESLSGLTAAWDTIDGATTRRIKITVPGTNQPEMRMVSAAALLHAAFSKDDINLNTLENRIIVRNPSAELKEMLRPLLLQQEQSRSH